MREVSIAVVKYLTRAPGRSSFSYSSYGSLVRNAPPASGRFLRRRNGPKSLASIFIEDRERGFFRRVIPFDIPVGSREENLVQFTTFSRCKVFKAWGMVTVESALDNAVLFQAAEPGTQEMGTNLCLSLNILKAPNIQTQLAHDQKSVRIHYLPKNLCKASGL